MMRKYWLSIKDVISPLTLVLLALNLVIMIIILFYVFYMSTQNAKIESSESIIINVPVDNSLSKYVPDHLYARSGLITAIDHYNDIVQFTDTHGMNWEFYGIEDWYVGDRLCVIFYDKNTIDPLDDQIIKATYEAYDY